MLKALISPSKACFTTLTSRDKGYVTAQPTQMTTTADKNTTAAQPKLLFYRYSQSSSSATGET